MQAITGVAAPRRRPPHYVHYREQDGLAYGPNAGPQLAALGKHKTGAACLYINRLADVDRQVLEDMIRSGYQHVMAELHRP
ncbi:hypothetical protein ACP3TD_00825 [Pseudarthrobacter sp. 1G09]|uniref:hypothetical protein n=1 Tax=Pseudarthrobacter sp. 1G09 TaxID=3416178 RepID=UPI003CEDEA44